MTAPAGPPYSAAWHADGTRCEHGWTVSGTPGPGDYDDPARISPPPAIICHGRLRLTRIKASNDPAWLAQP